MIYTDKLTKAIYAKSNVIVKKCSMHNAVKRSFLKLIVVLFIVVHVDTSSLKKLQDRFNRMFHKFVNLPSDCSISQTLLKYNIDNLSVLL